MLGKNFAYLWKNSSCQVFDRPVFKEVAMNPEPITGNPDVRRESVYATQSTVEMAKIRRLLPSIQTIQSRPETFFQRSHTRSGLVGHKRSWKPETDLCKLERRKFPGKFHRNSRQTTATMVKPWPWLGDSPSLAVKTVRRHISITISSSYLLFLYTFIHHCLYHTFPFRELFLVTAFTF